MRFSQAIRHGMIMQEGLFFERNEGAFHYIRWPGGLESLHFSHATGFNGLTYGPLLDRLSSCFSVTAMDFRGHGKTLARAEPSQLTDWGVFCDDLEAFIEHIGAPVIAAGHSLGAVVSMMAAARRPELIKGLVLIDPAILPLSWMWWWYLAKKTGLSRFVPIAFRASRRRWRWPDEMSLKAAYAGKKIFGSWSGGFLEGYLNGGTTRHAGGGVSLTCSPSWEAKVFATCPHEIWGIIPFIRKPVLVIYGKKSDTFLPAAQRRLSKVLPMAWMVGMEGAGHFVPMERPAETAEAVVEFAVQKLGLKKATY